MSGQLGELVISLSADMARFREDMGKANKITQDTVKKMQSDVASGMGNLKASFDMVSKSFATVAAVAAGGAIFADVVNSTKAWVSETVKLAKTMGMTTQEASAYNVALRLTGNDVDTAMMATSKLTKTLTTNQAAFEAHKIAIKDTSGHLLPMTQIITNTFEALSKLKSGTDRNTAAQELLGKSFIQLSSMAKITNDVLVESKKLSEDLGMTVDGKTAEAVKNYAKEMNKLKLVHEAFKVNVGEMVLPPLNKIEQGFNAIAIAAAKTKSKGGMSESFTVDMASMLLVEQRLRSKDFLLHPIDTVTKLTADLHALKKAGDAIATANNKPVPELGGDTNEASNAADRKAEAAAMKAAVEQERLEFNKGVQSYNRLVDAFNSSRTDLSDLEKALAKVNDEVAELSKAHPEQAKDAAIIGEKTKAQLRQAEAQKIQNAEVKESIKLLEEMNKDVAAFSTKGLGQALEVNLPKPKYSLLGDSAGTPLPGGKYSLMGAAETTGFGGNQTDHPLDMVAEARKSAEAQRQFASIMAAGNPYQEQLLALQDTREQQIAEVAKWDDTELGMAEKKAQALKKIDEDYYRSRSALRRADYDTAINAAVGLGNQMASLMMQGNKRQFEQGKKLAMAMAVVDTAMGVSKALGSAPPPMNFIMAAMTAASGAVQLATIQSTQYQGREKGGPVSAGTPYIVGEKRPELFIPGQSGTIVPYVPNGQRVTISPTIVYNVSPGVPEAVDAAIQRAAPALTQMTTNAVKAAIRQGNFLEVF